MGPFDNLFDIDGDGVTSDIKKLFLFDLIEDDDSCDEMLKADTVDFSDDE